MTLRARVPALLFVFCVVVSRITAAAPVEERYSVLIANEKAGYVSDFPEEIYGAMGIEPLARKPAISAAN